jgi:hypothetical protein
MKRERFRELTRPFFSPNPDPDHAVRMRAVDALRRATACAVESFAAASAAWQPGTPTPRMMSDEEIETQALIFFSVNNWTLDDQREEFAAFLDSLMFDKKFDEHA